MGAARTATLLMYEPGVMVVDEGFFGKVLRYGARVLLRSFASPYHAPVNPKLTRPFWSPDVNTSSAPNSGGMFVAAKVWKDAIPLEAVLMSRLFHVYWKTIAEGGAGKVCTSMDVTIPNDGDAPRIACGAQSVSEGKVAISNAQRKGRGLRSKKSGSMRG